ncbi:MAG: hypothetical protein ACI8S6_005261 [Myxococcota bacterium]
MLLAALLLGGCRMADFDADGLLADVDCDDLLDDVYPGADELCDGIDNDCDGDIDESPVDGDYVYRDGDGDGFGTGSEYAIACEVPAGFAAAADDCDDEDPGTFPGAPEICDGLDNDCDHIADNGLEFVTYYIDEDGDGFGGYHIGSAQCAPSPGTAELDGDCDDDDPETFPGAATADPELCTRDLDRDGYGDQTPNRNVDPGGDCDDDDETVNPDSPEICRDYTDNDCDGIIDEGC